MKRKYAAITETLLTPLPDVVAYAVFIVWGLALVGGAIARML